MSRNSVNWNDASGTITLGGTAQTALVAVASQTATTTQLVGGGRVRNGLMIQNNSDTTMWFNENTTAVQSQPSIQIVAGATFIVTSPDPVPQGLISVIGATTAKTFTLKYM